MQRLGEFFFGKRRTPLRWVAVLPGLIALVFLGHAFEDAGFIGALPYIVIVFVSVAYVIRPRVILWILLFGVFVLYAVLVALHPGNGPASEWVDFMLIGSVPAILMLFAWPLKLEDT